jgi:ribose 5-phosphate isomerase A
MSQENGKKAAAKKAVSFIENKMIVGLGTGSTAAYFIQYLIEKKLNIQVVASSQKSATLAKKGGLSLLDINEAPRIDLTVDGADEIDSKKRMIKGGGGAHVREKILACASGEMIVIIDETKVVSLLGKAKLPVEILRYGASITEKKIEALGMKGKWRLQEDGSLFITENGNFLFDIHFEKLLSHPEKEHLALLQIPGVVDTGFFLGMAGRVIVGHSDGRVECL